MKDTRLTIVLLILIVLAAMWTSGRLTALSNAILGKKTSAGGSAGAGVAALNSAGGGSADAKPK